MYTTVKKFAKFDTDKKDHMDKYERIINNPLCMIIDNMKEKIVLSQYDKGKLVSTETKIVFAVTYEQKELL